MRHATYRIPGGGYQVAAVAAKDDIGDAILGGGSQLKLATGTDGHLIYKAQHSDASLLPGRVPSGGGDAPRDAACKTCQMAAIDRCPNE